MSDQVVSGDTYPTHIPTGEEVVRKFRSRVEGQTIVITGVSDGSIGAVAAKAFAAAAEPEQIFLLARSEPRVAPVLEAITQSNMKVQARFVSIDMMELSSVRRAAARVLALAPQIHILMNFASIFVKPEYIQSAQGVEQHFATNHLGHFLLTNLLVPSLLTAGPGARVVQLSSNSYAIRPFLIENYNFQDGKTYHPWEAYSQADSACILFARELSHRLKAHGHVGLGVFSADPGFVPDSNLNNHLPPDHIQGATAKYLEFHESVAEGIVEGLLSLEQGAAAPLVAALDPEMDGHEGCYVIDCKAVPEDKMLEKWVVDDELAKELWELDEKLVGEKFL